MNNASRLHDALLDFVGQCAWSDQRHAYVLVWVVIEVIQEGSVNLTRWVCHVQTPAQQAQSTPRRFARWLLPSPALAAAVSPKDCDRQWASNSCLFRW